MDKPSRILWLNLRQTIAPSKKFSTAGTQSNRWICSNCLQRSRLARPGSSPRPSLVSRVQRRHQSTNPADNPEFHSVVDNPPTLIRSGKRHKPLGLLILAAIPVTAFALGCWQVQRLGWKTTLIARFEDRLVREPLPLPPAVDVSAVPEFDYRRVVAKGKWRHDQEMLVGPRLHDGNDGYLVITPLDRSDQFPEFKGNSTILVCRGWIPKAKAAQSQRPDGLPKGDVVIEGLLREPWKRNMFTPVNKPYEDKWYFPDVHEMAEHVGAQPIWVEETMKPDLLASYDREARGIPIGRTPEVNLRNNHAQYIFTWFSLSAATSVMLWMVVRKPPKRSTIRQNTSW